MPEIDLLKHYPKSKRPIDDRAKLITEAHREIARQFGKDFFDGDRLNGYGGFGYHPRFWTDTVALFRDHYGLASDASILDVGCAKGFMLYDFQKLMPDAHLAGIDVSEYAIENAQPEVKDLVSVADAKDLPFDDNSFDLVISVNTVHNLALEECKESIREIERVSRGNSFITMDAYHSETEHAAMLAWNLTALTHMYVTEWEDLFREVGYTGDYNWFIAVSDE
jgi:ubiquinone/menaquinone biosynthesis C-methylase UbiE